MSTISILTLCLAVTGCVHSGESVDEEQLSQIVSGKTTAADLVRIIGEPTSRTYREDGSQVMAWGYARIGMFFGVGTKVQSTAFVIGPSGTVSGYSRGGSTPVAERPLVKAEQPAPAPTPAQPMTEQAYKDAQVRQLMQKNLPYDEYQKQYRAIMDR